MKDCIFRYFWDHFFFVSSFFSLHFDLEATHVIGVVVVVVGGGGGRRRRGVVGIVRCDRLIAVSPRRIRLKLRPRQLPERSIVT